MTAFLTRHLRTIVAAATRLIAKGRRRSAAFGELWRRSLQIRVVVSTLALGSAVVFVLGMVLQSQITDRLIGAKEQAAVEQTRAAVLVAQRELLGLSAGPDLVNRLDSALTKLASSSPDPQSGTASAGAFEPVLASDGLGAPASEVRASGRYEDVPRSMREFVLSGTNRMVSQIYTVDREGEQVTFLMVGAPVTSGTPNLQLYMLYPLTAEQRTVEVVQSTLLVGGIVLMLLLAGITNLVTRQVVLPVRRAARAAERFAEGELDERMVVAGEDDVARLAQSYNEMAESIERQIRQLEEFGQLQRRFTSDVSHELRTPLTTVRMAADVLHASRKQFPAGLARSTELLVDELDRFETLLADLLEISRLDAGVEELVAEYADLRAISRRAVESVRVIARRSGSEIVLDLPDEEVIAEVESRRVERILRNLLANAIDHGEGRPVELRLAADDDAIAFTVRDHGVGLRTGEAELVFNRFWRADPSRNRHTGGTGLGLAISLEDARLHGGGLDAWGEPGEGACFRLTLPRRQGEEYGDSPLALPPVEQPVPEEVSP
ncbi:MtrAB system histidine kinase MtrB [Actinokineospora sp. HUAS TT18]|uniref:MtrAB system histidine kinase MtrB n=1 Tax=Actinokineospora sp. HUAS TT18 TaxID=3447451 RepID=UPI003F51EFA1